jgi:hypothetical protein
MICLSIHRLKSYMNRILTISVYREELDSLSTMKSMNALLI